MLLSGIAFIGFSERNKDVLFEESVKSRRCYSGICVVVYLYRNADAVAVAGAEIPGEGDVILKSVFCDGFFEKLYQLV